MTYRTLLPDKYLDLSGGRTLAYTDVGDPSSSTLVLFFHDAISVGNTDPRLPPILLDKAHIPYHITIASDITALINHLHPHNSNLRIYVFGGGFGGIPAQMLYGAPFDIFPFGRNIIGCMLLSSFSSFKLHQDYTRDMNMLESMIIGTVSQYIPFQLGSRLGAFSGSRVFSSVDRAEDYIRQTFFKDMSWEDREAFAKWREVNGTGEGGLERGMAERKAICMQHSWDGFLDVPDVVNGDWGFHPAALDEEHYNHRPMFLVFREDDKRTVQMALWLAANYKNSHIKSLAGGRFAPLFNLNQLWKEVFDLCPASQ
ncbi:hypothetical protein BDZ97DRAFT_1911554 [Flammula alnicola]|nr:hypothetical protein BDZ97DRAFT_1911554 [Flammula alnicola]